MYKKEMKEKERHTQAHRERGWVVLYEDPDFNTEYWNYTKKKKENKLIYENNPNRTKKIKKIKNENKPNKPTETSQNPK